MTMRIFAIACAVLLSMPGGAQAQPPPAPQSAAPINFRVMSAGRSIEGLHYGNAGKDEPLTILPDVRSRFHPWSSGPQIVFYTVRTGSDGAIIREPAVRADVGQAGPQPLILFLDSGTATGFRTMVIAEDLASFPLGTYRIVNFGSRKLSAKFAGQDADVPPGLAPLVKVAGEPRTVLVQVFDPVRGKKGLVYSNNWAFYPATRTLLFASEHPDRAGAMVFRRIVETDAALLALSGTAALRQ